MNIKAGISKFFNFFSSITLALPFALAGSLAGYFSMSSITNSQAASIATSVVAGFVFAAAGLITDAAIDIRQGIRGGASYNPPKKRKSKDIDSPSP